MRLGNEEIIRKLYAAAEGQEKDIDKFVSFFSEEGYMCDIPSGMKLWRLEFQKRGAKNLRPDTATPVALVSLEL